MSLAGNLFNLGSGEGTNSNNNDNYGNTNNNNDTPFPNQINRGRTIDPSQLIVTSENAKYLLFTVYFTPPMAFTPSDMQATMGSLEYIILLLKNDRVSEHSIKRIRKELTDQGWSYVYNYDDTQLDYIIRADLIQKDAEPEFDPNPLEASVNTGPRPIPVAIAENLRNIGNVFNARNNGIEQRENAVNANNNNPRGGRRKKTRKSKKSLRKTRRR